MNKRKKQLYRELEELIRIHFSITKDCFLDSGPEKMIKAIESIIKELRHLDK